MRTIVEYYIIDTCGVVAHVQIKGVVAACACQVLAVDGATHHVKDSSFDGSGFDSAEQYLYLVGSRNGHDILDTETSRCYGRYVVGVARAEYN